ncbi:MULTISPECIES: hypothetical protein [unclassified Limnospira]|uniref:hypothetical protein n=1 Tax=Limnospira TaxID=2596745 RepID=UPI000280406C|nr:hypothetical protein [Limnospira maxima]EKD09597.1 hypothetical protein SPLC1_S170460 [Arthrospira platensis C1]
MRLNAHFPRVRVKSGAIAKNPQHPTMLVCYFSKGGRFRAGPVFNSKSLQLIASSDKALQG